MKFRDVIDSPCGLRYCFDSLQIESGYSRRMLLDTEMMCDREEIESYYVDLRQFLDLAKADTPLLNNLKFKLQGLRDINATITSLEEGDMLDDIAMFEIKNLALLSDDIQVLFKNAKVDIPWLQYSMGRVIEILDPDGLKIGSFYIYDTYSMELRSLRKANELDPNDEVTREKMENEEERIRKILCNLLRSHSGDLTNMLHGLAKVDILISKALQMVNEGFTFPEFSQESSYKGLFHPEVRYLLSQKGKKFQNVDFEHRFGIPSTIIGANMGGKTVVLKSLTLCQYLYQFGFGVPAKEAAMFPFEEIYFCIGDEQSQEKGLSSFAAEMKRIDNVLKRVKMGGRILALIDEPARTTNPVEGTALVTSLLRILYKKENLDIVMTTHYNVEHLGMCWKVRGLVHGSMNYELLRTESSEVPHEALNIATELGIDSEWLEEARKCLDEEKCAEK